MEVHVVAGGGIRVAQPYGQQGRVGILLVCRAAMRRQRELDNAGDGRFEGGWHCLLRLDAMAHRVQEGIMQRVGVRQQRAAVLRLKAQEKPSSRQGS